MRIAAFNVENLFDRARIMNLENWDDGQPVLDAYSELTSLLEEESYSKTNKAKMANLMIELDLEKDDTGQYVTLRRNRGRLVKRPKSGGIEIIADGRDDWIGWLELRGESVNEIGIDNTGRVIRDVDADVLAVVEAEDRVALKEFGDQVLERVGGQPYPHVMMIDGNDRRGIDVGLMTKNGYDITLMQSHVHELNSKGYPIFSRDCPEFLVETSSGQKIWFLVNHFKSKGYGSKKANDARRKSQASAVATYYERLKNEGYDNVVVLGDLNDLPDSDPLEPLLKDTDLREVSEHVSFDTGEFPGKGTYKLGNDTDKIDYILLSPALFNKVTAAGVFRKGAWPGSRPKRWDTYKELKKKIHVASDHHAIWVDVSM
ncbi:endonuclease/exonuclease/phosphatase family protein [Pseudooctadecabacter jejudonensis]|uniref:Endonuclease/Exonuclease/phosphatase family protein n=1 Tax=Pseudooctadecabacter jejudonensis TaxID=1391910 RepID=A0A1Y5T664_9RHOB|nr:endonuclease/exonuclease/phosphatase family protein [Pseudooctadecabacter jejudonensis]SLN56753.1 Endonuclease/Exonuclease/phosphatase family protein [Pseudooctadecabacter jejudonensis]